jgi:DNA-binding LytR/AlgR family response regulator
MLHFRICDTDVKFLEGLALMLHQLYDPCSVEYMYGPDVLEVSLRCAKGCADVLLTEVELREKRSIDLINRYQSDSDSMRVIYMTGNIQYCTEVYETRHSGFLLKPLDQEALKKAVDRALRELRRERGHSICVQHGRNLHVIEFSALQRAESRGRVLRLFTEKEQIEIYGKISDLCANLDQRFLWCHKSHLINMDYVRSYTVESFCMRDGTVVPISQSHRKAVRENFLTYVGVERA